VGAITLARAVDDHELALSILTAAHALVMTQDGNEPGGTAAGVNAGSVVLGKLTCAESMQLLQ
jgi:hypothetical protein